MTNDCLCLCSLLLIFLGMHLLPLRGVKYVSAAPCHAGVPARLPHLFANLSVLPQLDFYPNSNFQLGQKKMSWGKYKRVGVDVPKKVGVEMKNVVFFYPNYFWFYPILFVPKKIRWGRNKPEMGQMYQINTKKNLAVYQRVRISTPSLLSSTPSFSTPSVYMGQKRPR